MTPSRYLIVPGDPAGVGPEIVEKWLQRSGQTASYWAVAGPESWIGTLRHRYSSSRVEWCPWTEDGAQWEIGKPSAGAARMAWKGLQYGAEACRSGQFRGLVTGPVGKDSLVREGFPFPGQTEFLADAWGGEPTMAFWGQQMKVVLATWHIPLIAVPSALNDEVVERAVERAFQLAHLGGEDVPRVAVCGLNPHAGENGLLGTEERDWLQPLLVRLSEKNPGLVTQPQPADTVFWHARHGRYDVVVALYHDQGLGPLKTVEFSSACQVTLGLPFFRTSPDHGTAYDLAGKGQADPQSFYQAVTVMEKLGNFRS